MVIQIESEQKNEFPFMSVPCKNIGAFRDLSCTMQLVVGLVSCFVARLGPLSTTCDGERLTLPLRPATSTTRESQMFAMLSDRCHEEGREGKERKKREGVLCTVNDV